jgi:hypothetical protein
MSGDPEPYHTAFTIAAAARHCGVARRTLQRAIQGGRLTLTADHRLTLDALREAGYAPATATQRRATRTPQGHTAATPQERPSDVTQRHRRGVSQAVSQVIAPLLERLDTVIALLERLAAPAVSQATAATPQRRDAGTSQRRTAATRPSDTAATPPQAIPDYDTTRYVLGRLCPRGHAYGSTGQTLRLIMGRKCRECEIEGQRERRRLTRAQLTHGQG